MLQIRLMGVEEDIQKATEELKTTFNVLKVSKPYKNRGENEDHRVYIDAELKED